MSTDDNSLICPITLQLFRDPVRAEDGRLYERAAITRWINEHGTSPWTRQALDVNRLQPDDQMRKKANQRRKLSVSYNRQTDQVQLPPIRTVRRISFSNRVNDIIRRRARVRRTTCCEYRECRCPDLRCNMSRCRDCFVACSPKAIICICTMIYLITSFITLIVVFSTGTSGPFLSSFTTIHYAPRPYWCRPFNSTFPTSSCLSSFANVTVLYSVECKPFAYDSFGLEFIPSSSNVTIIFAFQQASGYWDIDDISLWDYNFTRSLFLNGDFESGSLSPNHNQCQSTGNISRNSSQFNGQYSYSDGTQGHFGYLMQQVSVIVGTWYYLDFFLQNRNGSNSSYAVLVGS